MIIYGKVTAVAGKRIVKELMQNISSKKKTWGLLDLFVLLNQIAEKTPNFKEKEIREEMWIDRFDFGVQC